MLEHVQQFIDADAPHNQKRAQVIRKRFGNSTVASVPTLDRANRDIEVTGERRLPARPIEGFAASDQFVTRQLFTFPNMQKVTDRAFKFAPIDCIHFVNALGNLRAFFISKRAQARRIFNDVGGVVVKMKVLPRLVKRFNIPLRFNKIFYLCFVHLKERPTISANASTRIGVTVSDALSQISIRFRQVGDLFQRRREGEGTIVNKIIIAIASDEPSPGIGIAKQFHILMRNQQLVAIIENLFPSAASTAGMRGDETGVYEEFANRACFRFCVCAFKHFFGPFAVLRSARRRSSNGRIIATGWL